MLNAAAMARTGTSLVSLRAAVPNAEAHPRVEPAAPCVAVRVDRRSDFLAQLIAIRDGLEQTRERRRIAPAAAVSAYRGAAELDRRGPLVPGRIA